MDRRHFITQAPPFAAAASVSLPSLLTSFTAQAASRPVVSGSVAGFDFLDSYPQAPDVAFQDQQGRDRYTREFIGKPILLTFWSVNCHGCIIEMPTLNRLRAQVGERDLIMLPVTIDQNRAAARAQGYYRRRNLGNLPIFTDSHRLLFGFYNGFATPMSFIIDKRGHVVGGKAGVARWDTPEALRLLSHYM